MTSGLPSVSKDVTAKALRTRPGAQPGFKYWRLLTVYYIGLQRTYRNHEDGHVVDKLMTMI